jgi:multidrug efflux pump subunit AcrA (membrane-fusion protein)
VRVAVEDKRHIVRPGMFAKASFGIDVTHAFVIAAASVLSVQGKSYVFVKTAPHCYERREITLGSQSGEWFIVLGGVKPGETVVTQGSLLLKSLSFGS